MTRAEVDFALELAAREGWNPGLDDAELLEGLQAAGRDGEVARTGKNEPRIETVPA